VTGHVLVVGVDGTRYDALGPAEAIRSVGTLTPVMIDEGTHSWSGPCWTTIATGVPMALHNVVANDFTGHRLSSYPDFLTVATRAGLSTLLAVSGWPPLATTEAGGPLFAEVTRREFVPVAWEDDVDLWDAADEAVCSLACGAIAADAPRVSFVYLGAVDVNGHVGGVDSAYHAAVRAADERVGRLVEAVRSRPTAEDWTIVVVTDHGHLDAGGHGGREPEVLTAWAAVSGFTGPPVTSQRDIAPLVLTRAGLR
jgi:predicted AlkP superfamily pyrophosphatase or phosphodiesterase